MYYPRSRRLWPLATVFLAALLFVLVGLSLVMASGIVGVVGQLASTGPVSTPAVRVLVAPGPPAPTAMVRYQVLTELMERPASTPAPRDASLPAPLPTAAPIAPGEAQLDREIQAIVARMAAARTPPPPAEIRVATYRELFTYAAEEFGLDWRLLASMAYRESRLDPLAVGKDGDMGLMQIMPATWSEFAPLVNETEPFSPYSNVRVAAAYVLYLAKLLEPAGKNQVQWVVLAYNWGPNNVLRLHRAGGDWQDVPALRRRYVRDIIQAAYGMTPPELE